MFSSFTKTSIDVPNNIYEYVITYDNFPYVIYTNRENAIKYMWDKANEFADEYRDDNQDYHIRIFQEDNQIIVTRQYKFFILSYEENILNLSIYKVSKIDKEN